MDGDIPKLDWYEAFSQIIKMDKNAKVVIVTGYLEFEQKNKRSRARTSFCYFKANRSKHVIRFGKEIFDLNNSEK